MKGGIEILCEHSGSLYWMISDQTVEFDDCVRLPIHDRPRFVQVIRCFLEYRNSVPPETLLTTVHTRLGNDLEKLCQEGEDIDRLGNWLLSMLDTDEKQRQNMQQARQSWGEGFGYWEKNGLPVDAMSRFPLAVECVKSYSNEVSMPYKSYIDRAYTSEKEWMAAEVNRSTLDNFLFDIFYNETVTCPITAFTSWYETVLQRTWFETAQQLYSDELFEALYHLLVPLAYDGHSLYSDPAYVKLAPLHEAFALNENCSFSKNCRSII